MSTVHFDRSKATILLRLDDAEMKRSSLERLKHIAKERSLIRKPEFHVTLIGRKTGEQILAKIEADKANQKNQYGRIGPLDCIGVLYEIICWDFEFEQTCFAISSDHKDPVDPADLTKIETRISIIQMIRLPELAIFYTALNRLFGTEFPIPPPHVTLYSKSTLEANMSLGIGIYSEEHLKSLKPKLLIV